MYALREKRVPLTTPAIGEENRITALHDLLLCTRRMRAAEIVTDESSSGSLLVTHLRALLPLRGPVLHPDTGAPAAG